MRAKLTDRLVASLKPGAEPHFDEVVPGLSIDTGARSQTFYFHFTSPVTGSDRGSLSGTIRQPPSRRPEGRRRNPAPLLTMGKTQSPRKVLAAPL